MPVTVVREFDVCHACACLIANGEVGDQEETEAQVAAIEAHYGPTWGRIVLACEEDECDRVAVGPCDACGQGERGYVMLHPAAELCDGPAQADACGRPFLVIPRGTAHLTSEQAYRMCADREGVREISDACAVTIASWYQVPRGPGEAFTRLVSHFPVSVTDLCDAIAYECAQASYRSPADRRTLGMLATWALNRHEGESL